MLDNLFTDEEKARDNKNGALQKIAVNNIIGHASKVEFLRIKKGSYKFLDR